MQIEVSFDRWKQLNALLRDEDDSHDAVIERLLASHAPNDLQAIPPPTILLDGGSGAYFKEVFLPNGTELRATYKGKTYFARIIESQWVDSTTGRTRTSPSQAAYSITGKNVNGWLFWVVKRPEDQDWRTLNALRSR